MGGVEGQERRYIQEDSVVKVNIRCAFKQQIVSKERERETKEEEQEFSIGVVYGRREKDQVLGRIVLKLMMADDGKRQQQL
jgi:hypothetical protein